MASTHKHIRSGTANKRPTTAIADGQIALNTNLSSPGLFFKDSTGAEILKIGPVHVGATAPNVSPAGSAGNSTGEVWLDISLTPVGVKIWNGSAFVNATPIGSTTVQGLLELATDAETQAGADTARAVTSASLQSKLSDSTSTTSATTIASSTAVKAAYDLANAALPKAGGTVTGNLEIGTAGSLSFEGATADGFETTIAVVDPTADRTITLPNTTGTVVTTGDTGTVTSTMLLDGTILNEDINASASIAYSKLATLTSGNIVLGSSANVATSTAVTGDVTITNAGVTAIAAGVIVNADVNASAAIAGSKVAPDFGAQNIVTTGSSTAATFNPTGTTAPVTGVYSPGANRLGITTNSVERVEFGTSEVVFNDDAADYDFRIEGDTNSNLFFADASAEAVGIRTATPVSEFNVSVGNGGNITISNTNDAHSAGLAFGDTTSNSSGRITYDHSTNALAISTNGTERLRLSSTGELMFKGAGTTPGTDKAVSFSGSAPINSMVLDSSGRLGIGTSAPAQLLHVKSSSAYGVIVADNNGATGGGLFSSYQNGAQKAAFGVSGSIEGNTTSDLGLFADSTGGAIRFYTNGSPVTKAILDSTGRLGIGTTSPDAQSQLHIVGSGYQPLFVNTTAAGGGGAAFFRSGTQALYVGTGGSSWLSGSSTADGLIRSEANLVFATGGNNQRAQIDSSGRLLVGTSSSIESTSRLQVKDGSLNIYHASAAAGAGYALLFTTDGSSSALAQAKIEGLQETANTSGGRLVFSTSASGSGSPTERMRINNTGDSFIYSNFYPLTVATNQGAGTTYQLITGRYSATSTTTGTDSFRVHSNGNVQNTNGSYTAISDAKLKENIVDASSQWNDLKAIHIRNWNFKEETGYETHRQIGPIAQELEAVCPGLVFETPDRDDKGNDLGTVTKGVNQSVLYMKAVKALQEAMERIETLEAKVAALESA